MTKLTLLIIAGALCAGCAGPQKPTTARPAGTAGTADPTSTADTGGIGGFMQRYSERRTLSTKLEQATDQLAKGDSAAAAKTLTAICSGSALAGVTDEALFRLALLSLRPNAEKPTTRHARHLLQRLRREYPASPWTVQAAPLTELIGVDEDLRRQNKNLKTSNQSLAREIKELTKSLEQLKHLDLELEQKTR
jgi:predicted RNase H-like nuclease (RuvC/YqgF family)